MPNINKVVYGNTTLIDLSTTTLSQTSQLGSGVTAYARDGSVLTGTGPSLQEKTVSPSESSIEVVPDDGQVLVVSTGSVVGASRTTTITKSVDLSDLIAGATYHVVGSGYVTNFNTGVVDNWEVDTDVVFNSTTTTLAFTHSGSFLSQLSVGSSSIKILVQTSGDNYANSNLSFYAYSGTAYDGLSKVTVNAISSTYVGTGITRRSSTDLTASGATVSVPAGYYESSASKAVANGTAGTPSATKGTVSNHSVSVTPSVTNTAGYISGGTVSGTAVSVSASELVSGSKSVSISSNGTTAEDVTNYASASITVNVPNTYTSGDEGKVVSNGALVSQTSDTVTQNGTVDTTLINSLTVNVSGGGGIDLDDFLSRTAPVGAISLPSTTTLYGFAFCSDNVITSISAPSLTRIGQADFQNCKNLESVYMPELLYAATTDKTNTNISNTDACAAFRYCDSLQTVHLPKLLRAGNTMFYQCNYGLSTYNTIIVLPSVELLGNSAFRQGKFKAIDLGPNYQKVWNDSFYGGTYGVVILRSTTLVTAATRDAVRNIRTLYVPSALVSSYATATNWVTDASLRTVLSIEGSIYETKYADGTPIT